MALDDVAIRAMSKESDDRYPSAGDLGRAAVAALSGSQPDLPERTVATGAAATRETETVAPAGEAETAAADRSRESTSPEPDRRHSASRLDGRRGASAASWLRGLQHSQ
jgi:hypothetical protein